MKTIKDQTFRIWLDYKEPGPDIKSPPHMMMYSNHAREYSSGVQSSRGQFFDLAKSLKFSTFEPSNYRQYSYYDPIVMINTNSAVAFYDSGANPDHFMLAYCLRQLGKNKKITSNPIVNNRP